MWEEEAPSDVVVETVGSLEQVFDHPSRFKRLDVAIGSNRRLCEVGLQSLAMCLELRTASQKGKSVAKAQCLEQVESRSVGIIRATSTVQRDQLTDRRIDMRQTRASRQQLAHCSTPPLAGPGS